MVAAAPRPAAAPKAHRPAPLTPVEVAVQEPAVSNTPTAVSVPEEAPGVDSCLAAAASAIATPAASSADALRHVGRAIRFTAAGLQVPVGNGGASLRGDYWWTQTLREVTLCVLLPRAARAADIHVSVSAVGAAGSSVGGARLSVSCMGAVALAGALGGGVVLDHAAYGAAGAPWTWDRDAGAAARDRPQPLPAIAEGPAPPPTVAGVLTLVLDKSEETWWRVAVAGGPAGEAIDATLVDSTRDVADYDPDTATAIRRVVYEQSHGGGDAGAAAALRAQAAAASAAAADGAFG